jgi:hypothetical protein
MVKATLKFNISVSSVFNALTCMMSTKKIYNRYNQTWKRHLHYQPRNLLCQILFTYTRINLALSVKRAHLYKVRDW